MLDPLLIVRLRQAGLPIHQPASRWCIGEAADVGPYESIEAAVIAGVACLRQLYDHADDEQNEFWVTIQQLTEEINALHFNDTVPPQPFRALIDQLDPSVVIEARIVKHATRDAYILLVGDMWYGDYESHETAQADAVAYGFTVKQ